MGFSFEIIDESNVEVSRRGRAVSEDVRELGEYFSNMTVGQIVRVEELAANDPKTKASNQQKIYAAARLAEVKVSVRWSPSNGLPQIKRIK